MSNLTSVGITAGVPTSGTGTASTIDALMALTPDWHTVAVKAASTAPAAADPALVVALSPNSVNANGQAAMAASAPITVASDQKYQTGMSNRVFSVAFSTLTRPANTPA